MSGLVDSKKIVMAEGGEKVEGKALPTYNTCEGTNLLTNVVDRRSKNNSQISLNPHHTILKNTYDVRSPGCRCHGNHDWNALITGLFLFY